MVWVLVLLPGLAGAALWATGGRVDRSVRGAVLGGSAIVVLASTLVLAVLAAARGAAGVHDLGAGLALHADLTSPADVVAVLVPAVAIVVVAWAAGHERGDDLPRLVGLLTGFVGAMELLVVAADLLTLLVGFELVGGLSWLMISHEWRDADRPRAAAHAYNATRAGGLGLFLAAGAAHAATGSLAFADLAGVGGPEVHVLAAGVLLAAAAKSAQGPFAPWLFSAMAGPTPVSALLHSSTMVAAGAYTLARLHPVLERADWFGPATIALGLATALAGGVVALRQWHAKRLLAASTSAQYGLMFVAVGAGHPAVAVVHLVAHAILKSQLFLSAGVAVRAAGTEQLARMRLGRHLPVTAGLTAVGSLSLAAVPPLGAAWSKESVVAAAGQVAPWLAVAVVAAGGLSAAYATRFHLLAYGSAARPRHGAGPRDDPDDPRSRGPVARPGAAEQAALATLALAGVALGALWSAPVRAGAARLLQGELAEGPAWELAASILVVAVTVAATWAVDRRTRSDAPASPRPGLVADWLGLPGLVRRVVVAPTLAAATALAAVDDRVVDRAVGLVARAGSHAASRLTAGVEPRVDAFVGGAAAAGRGLARAGTVVAERGIDGGVAAMAGLVERLAVGARRTHTGLVHHQFVVIVLGLGLVAVAAVAGR